MKTKHFIQEFDKMNRNCDGTYGTGKFPPEVKRFFIKALDEQRDGIISEIAQYSGINDIQTKELIKIIKEL